MTLQYEVWLCIHKGEVVISQNNLPGVNVNTGETVYITNGARFKPSFPVDTEYIPICYPAFRPDLCIREDVDEEGEAISSNLKKLHGQEEEKEVKDEEPPEVLYHMCPKVEWEAAKSTGDAYFPKTFFDDEFLTHATGVPSRLISTANHYYQDSVGDWICLQFTRAALKKAGIFVRDEHATAVGDKETDSELMGKWVCPHIIGGIPLHVVEKEHRMIREGVKYVSIENVC
ncbi:hypothetical protein TL16_g11781 [Triparma laevis f. inornata]|uniref:Uncharacterized protein n=2 Tax=Triparma laevis TaxID=1534972 RepID=A0A9W7ETW2_9STRA|nr:hypothetical protein TL16_g11781 [Triparma laevis f. inornata]